MDFFTLGHISGGIAAGITLLQFIVPNALVVILVTILSDRHSAVTWSVAGREILASQWPFFLRSDAVASRSVYEPVRWITWARPVTLVLVTIAAIVTPMGLYQTFDLSKTPSVSRFAYVPDPSIMGLGTTPRKDLGFWRLCRGEDMRDIDPCPGSEGSTMRNYDYGTFAYLPINNDTRATYDARISRTLADLYQSGLSEQNRTVSSFFDIEARSYTTKTLSFNHHNQTAVNPIYQRFQSFVLQDKIELVEGLIVDSTQSPKIGFRNHTAPEDTETDSEWEEDLLFMEPDTSCVDLNVTYEGQAGDGISDDSLPGFLVDKGGFAHLNRTSPWPLDLWHGGSGQRAALRHRAYSAGWYSLINWMYLLNITAPDPQQTGVFSPFNNSIINSTVDQRWAVNSTSLRGSGDYDQLYITEDWTLAMEDPEAMANYDPLANSSSNSTSSIGTGALNFTFLSELCRGYDDTDDVNATNLAITCSIMVGPPRFDDGPHAVAPKEGAWFSRRLYSCASATKVSIKSVRFRYNTTSRSPPSLQNLQVMAISDKNYSSETTMPLWGVESPHTPIERLNGLWGLITDEKRGSTNLTSVRAEAFYIPASLGSYWTLAESKDNVPGTEGPSSIWSQVFDDLNPNQVQDNGYTGRANLALFNKWSNLSQTEEGASTIFDLVFLNAAANSLVGTKSQLSPSLSMPPNLQRLRKRGSNDEVKDGQALVYKYRNQVHYRWLFAIPACICLVFSVVICVSALSLTIFGKGGPTQIRHYLHNLSSGRILAAKTFYGGDQQLDSDTKSWITEFGHKDIGIAPKLGYSKIYSHNYDNAQVGFHDGHGPGLGQARH